MRQKNHTTRVFCGLFTAVIIFTTGLWSPTQGQQTSMETDVKGTPTAMAYTLAPPVSDTPELPLTQEMPARHYSESEYAPAAATAQRFQGDSPATSLSTATLSLSPASLDPFTYLFNNGPSAPQLLTLSGTNLSATNVVVEASVNYEIALEENGSYSSSLSFNADAEGTLISDIYVRLAADVFYGTRNGEIDISGGGAPDVQLPLTGEVTTLPPLVLYEFNDANGSPTAHSPYVTASELLVTSGLVNYSGSFHRFPGSGVPYARRFRGWDEEDIETANNFYFSLTSDVPFNLSNLSFYYLTNFHGPRDLGIEINGSVVDILENISYSGAQTYSLELTEFNNLTEVVVRIKAWGGNVTWDFVPLLSIDDIRLDGEIVDAQHSATIAGDEGWRFLSSPAAGSTYAELFSNIWTQGVEGSNNPPPTDFSPNVVTLNGSNDYVPIGSLNDQILPGSGVGVYIFEDDDPVGSPGEVTGGFPKTLSVSGLPPSEDVTITTLNTGDGAFSIVGNPFSSPVKFSEFITSEIGGVVYVYSHNATAEEFDLGGGEAGGGFLTYSNGGTGSGSLQDGILSPFQGFLVFAKGDNPTLTIPTAAQVEDDGLGLMSESWPMPAIQFISRINESQVGRVWLSFNEDGTYEYNTFDAPYLYPLDYRPFLSMYTEGSGYPLQLKNLPLDLTAPTEVPLHLQAWQPDDAGFVPMHGSVELIWPVFEHIPDNWDITLTDNHTGERVELREAESYHFDLVENTNKNSTLPYELAIRTAGRINKNAQARFTLKIDPQPNSAPISGELPGKFALKQNYPNPFNPTTRIEYQLPEGSDVRLEVFNIQGQQVATLVNATQTAGSHSVIYDAQALSSGIYFYRLTAGPHVFTRKFTFIK